MDLDVLWLTRLQQLIFKIGINDKIEINDLLEDNFSDIFIRDAVNEGYLSKLSDGTTLEMTDKLRYMPATPAKFKLDPKQKANKFNRTDPQLVRTTYESAKKYHLACIVLAEKTQANFNGEEVEIITPAFMVGTFACELYLKAILLSAGMHKTGHGLIDLYTELPADEKKEILDFFAKHNYTQDCALQNLDDISEAFVEIRYKHEITGFCFNAVFIVQLLEVLSERCKHRIQ